MIFFFSNIFNNFINNKNNKGLMSNSLRLNTFFEFKNLNKKNRNLRIKYNKLIYFYKILKIFKIFPTYFFYLNTKNFIKNNKDYNLYSFKYNKSNTFEYLGDHIESIYKEITDPKIIKTLINQRNEKNDKIRFLDKYKKVLGSNITYDGITYENLTDNQINRYNQTIVSSWRNLKLSPIQSEIKKIQKELNSEVNFDFLAKHHELTMREQYDINKAKKKLKDMYNNLLNNMYNFWFKDKLNYNPLISKQGDWFEKNKLNWINSEFNYNYKPRFKKNYNTEEYRRENLNDYNWYTDLYHNWLNDNYENWLKINPHHHFASKYNKPFILWLYKEYGDEWFKNNYNYYKFINKDNIEDDF